MKYSFTSLILLLLWSCNTSTDTIVFKTSFGEVVCELYPDKAPITVSNFLRYVDEERLDSACFYRVVTIRNQPHNDIKIEVVQGGLFDDEHPLMLAPIVHETTKQTGILHSDGVISMARNQPGTATSEFFICIGNQPELDFGGMRNPDGQGFAAFGKVIKGMDVIRRVQKQGNSNQMLNNKVSIESVRRR